MSQLIAFKFNIIQDKSQISPSSVQSGNVNKGENREGSYFLSIYPF